jgi:ATP-independent RNA helicase DbpA
VQVLARFPAGCASVLVATDVASRGLDIEKLEAVLNIDHSAGSGGLRPPHRPYRPGRGIGARPQLFSEGERALVERIEAYRGAGAARGAPGIRR